jgi:xanthine dehydrogenase YagT iron-sulfur-binding subunit
MMVGERTGSHGANRADMLVSFTVNGVLIEITVDPRMTLLDAIRNVCGLTGSKKGCDQGQCGACTMLVGERRINSCLSLAVTHEGDDIITIEGLGSLGQLHPMQAAFVEQDGLQCGFCTPGQICSAVGALDEWRRGVPSHVSDNLEHIELSEDEIRERMSGNLCRCAAYPNIVAAIRDFAEAQS